MSENELVPRRRTRSRAKHPWPRDGFVVVLGSESPESPVFLRVELVSRLLGDDPILRVAGDQQWLSNVEGRALRTKLELLASQSENEPQDSDDLRKALALVDYELARGTGIAVVPPRSPTAPLA